MSESHSRLVGIVKEFGHRRFEEPLRLASGDLSHDFIDGKQALARGEHLRLAAEEMLAVAESELGARFDAAGGLTMGADQFAHAMAVLRPGLEWFSVRKQAKDRGTRQRVEGARLGPGRQVLLIEDVVTRGGSIADAMEAIQATGATVVAAVSFVDRAEFGAEIFRRHGIPYRALLTYKDLGIEAVGVGGGDAAGAAGQPRL